MLDDLFPWRFASQLFCSKNGQEKLNFFRYHVGITGKRCESIHSYVLITAHREIRRKICVYGAKRTLFMLSASKLQNETRRPSNGA